MILPGVRRRAFRIPQPVIPFALGIAAITLTIVAWALLSPSPAGIGTMEGQGASVSDVRSIAYTIPGPDFDEIVVREASGIGLPRVVATFPSSGLTNVHARGASSPRGDQIAILWVPAFSTSARISILDLSVSPPVVRDVPEAAADPLSGVAWSADGSRFAFISAEQAGTPDPATRVVEVETATLTLTPRAEYSGVLEVSPVGYSFDGERLFVVVVDQKGSNLHALQPGGAEVQAELSPGRTRDWALSPDGSRLAFVDILGGGSRTFVGRTLLLATGQIITVPAEKNQFGASWVPGSPSAAFGGPGGEWQLTDPGAEDTMLVPNAWSPDGAYLVATLSPVSPGAQGSSRPVLELISRETSTAPSVRVRISEAAGAAFLGWVKNVH